MDNDKKLSEGLLKADGIDPAGATESERIAFGRMLDEQSKSKQSKPGIAWPGIRRTIMKHKLTKLAAAAVVMVAVMLGLNIIGGPDIASVALADVAKEIEQIRNCVFKKTTTMSSEDNGTNSFDSLVYYTEAAVREDLYDDDKELAHQVYVTFSEGILVGVDHKERLFRKMDLTDEDMEKLSPVSPKNIVNLILGKGKYKELGRKTVDGVLSEGFEFNDKRAMLSMNKDKVEDVVTRLWVDVSTNLPVRIEVSAVLNNFKANVVMCDPKWDVELESDFFEPKIPVDYIKPEERGLIGINLENWPTVKAVSGMAAEEAGVRNGDVALEVNGISISHVKSGSDALNLLFGKAGEKVVLTVKRGEQILTFEIERMPLPE